MIHLAIRIAGATLALALLGTAAGAVERNCPSGQIWDPNQGACVKKKQARKLSPEQKYYQALEHLDGSARRANSATGVTLLEQACRARHGSSCTMLGFLHLSGRAVAEDPAAAVRYYGQGCELDDALGCLGAADVHGRGVLGAIDHKAALPFLDRACGLDSGKGCYQLGQKYEYANGVAADGARAWQLYVKAFGLLRAECPGNGPSCHLLGLAYFGGRGTTKDLPAAHRAWQQGCDAGSGDACYQLGGTFYWGNGVAVNKRRAVQIYQQACTRYDNADACHDAGVLMATDDDVPGEPAEMMRLGERACELDRRQCELLAYLYGTGKGGREDQILAARWYRTACDAGSDVGCSSAAHRAFGGTGMAKDQKLAVDLWQKACDLNHAASCKEVGKRYYYGEPVSKDLARATHYFELGCKREDANSCHWLGELVRDGQDGTGAPKPQDGLGYFERSCDMGEAAACDSAADLLSATRDDFTKDLARAHAFYQRGCQGGYGSSCTDLGHMYDRGEGVDLDPLAAAKAYQEACRLREDWTCFWIDAQFKKAAGATAEDKRAALQVLKDGCAAATPHEHACMALGYVYVMGGAIGGKDQREAFRLFEASCQRKHGDSCVQLAAMYVEGVGVVKDVTKAKALYTNQCNGGTAAACTWLGWTLWQEDDFKGAVPLFQRACDEGDGNGCNMIGFANYTGKGTRWDATQAVAYFEKGCERNSLVACSNVGAMYEYGIGRAKDLVKSLELAQKACTPTESSGCSRVARFYAEGLGGVEVDLARAEREFERSCNDQYATSAEACRELALYYRKHDKVPASQIAALMQKAFDLAVESAKGNPYGHYQIGLMYREGLAVKANLEKAAEHFLLSCKGYDPLGCIAAGEIYLKGEGVPADAELAAVQFDRACAAQVQEACAQAETARAGGAAGPPELPLKPGPKSDGCACRSGHSDLGGWLPLALVLAVVLRRRRCAAPFV